jgi:alpha-galactosidase
MPVKITLIGAGSAIFSLNLVRDLCLCEGLRESTVCLMDTDPARLESIHSLCTRYSAELGAALRIEKTADRREALKGADFVINTALAAGHDRLREGWAVAKRHGYHFGGSLHVFHDEAFWVNYYQLDLMESLARDILEICPRAWFVMVANPVLAGVTLLSRKYPALRLVGLCHGYGGVYKLAERLGLDRSRLTFEAPGVNHFVWLTEFRHAGVDAYPLLDRWLAEKAEAYWKDCGPSEHEGRKPCDLYRRYGLFPIGDTGTPGGGAWGWWYHDESAAERGWGEDAETWYANYFAEGLDNVARIRRAAEDRSLSVRKLIPEGSSDEPMIPLIEALACDAERVVIVNIPNRGSLVPGIPEDFEVEVPALVSARGIEGIRTKGLPRPLIAHILRDRVGPVEIELDAYERGSRKGLVDLVATDHWTRSMGQAEALVREILELPYHGAMRAHYL